MDAHGIKGMIKCLVKEVKWSQLLQTLLMHAVIKDCETSIVFNRHDSHRNLRVVKGRSYLIFVDWGMNEYWAYEDYRIKELFQKYFLSV